MKNLVYAIGASIGMSAVLAAPIFAFGTFSDVYLLKNPTQAQVETLVKGNADDRVWFDDAVQVYQGSSLIKMTFRTRYFEGGRVLEFLDEVGVEYELLSKGTKNR